MLILLTGAIRNNGYYRTNRSARLALVPPMSVWYGPRTLTKVRQVCIPVELLRELGLDAGSRVRFSLTADGQEIRVKPVALDDEGEMDA